MHRNPVNRLAAALTALTVTGALSGCGALGGEDVKTLTASFDRAVGLYKGSDVRVLGVRIGEVTAVEPDGETVRVEMTYEDSYDIPADARALIVAPSIVSDRYVQLTPVFEGGPVLDDGAVLASDRTAVPLELDQVYASLDKLNLALGPAGANKDGALSDLLEVGAENLDGNGRLLNTTLKDFSQLVATVDDSREELFGTVANLQEFSTTLARSDGTVRAFNSDLAQVAAQLGGEREDLARSVRELSVALGEVAGFVRENREDLTANVGNLADVTGVLVKQRTALEEFLDVAPTALSDLQLAYNPSTGTLDTRDNGVAELETDPLGFVCQLLLVTGQQVGGLDLCAGLPLPVGAAAAPAVPGAGAAAPVQPAPLPAPAPRDMTLGGILDGGR